MTKDAQPVIVAFDGSPEARAAVGSAAALFRDRKLLIATVWEPGLAMMVSATADTSGPGMPYPPLPTAEEVETVDRTEHDHAESAAAAGVRLARELGAEAEPLSLPDTVNVAETLAEIAESRDAAALVVGSRGLGAVKSRLMGSTSRKLLHDTRRPVLVVRTPG